MRMMWVLGALAVTSLAIGAVSAQSEPDVVLAMPTPTESAVAFEVPLPSEPDRIALAMPSASVVSLPITDTVDAVAARAAIEKANSEWLTAFRKDDRVSLARIYADDASLFPPSSDSLEGRDRIVDYFGAQRKAGMRDAKLKTLDVVCVGDVAYEVGTYGFRFEGDATAGGGDAGRYFAIWKSRPDGTWRYHVGIWSSNRDTSAIR